MNKNILILLYSYYPFEDANTSVALPIINNLIENGFSVDIISCNYDGKNKKHELIGEVNVYRFSQELHYRLFRQVMNRFPHKLLSKNDATKKDVQNHSLYDWLINHVPEYFFQKIINFVFQSRNLQKTLKKVLMNKQYSCIIPITSPITTQLAVLKMYKSGVISHDITKYIAYFMDPWASYIGFKHYQSQFLLVEDSIYSTADVVVVTPEMYFQDNKNNRLNKYVEKTKTLELCCLHQTQSNNHKQYFDEDKINCIFCGSLHDLAVRNPVGLFKLINECDENKIQFHFVISRLSDKVKKLYDAYLGNQSNCTLYGRLPLNTCHSMMVQADVCINIGNTVTNQIPSKIFEYIGSGTAIANIVTCDNDPTINLMQNYPIALNINITDDASFPELARKFEEFCYLSKGKKVPFDIIETKYSNYLGTKAAKNFEKIIRGCIE